MFYVWDVKYDLYELIQARVIAKTDGGARRAIIKYLGGRRPTFVSVVRGVEFDFITAVSET